MTTSHMSTATDTTHTVLSQDGAKISYLSMAADYAAFASALAEHFTIPGLKAPGLRHGDEKPAARWQRTFDNTTD